MRKSSLRKLIKDIILEALANKYGQGGNLDAAEQVANAQWGNVHIVMPKGEEQNNVFYRVTLHSSNGPVKYLKQDPNGKWYFMDPPQKVWRPVNPAQVPQQPTNECGCAPGCNCKRDKMDGDAEGTMATANLSGPSFEEKEVSEIDEEPVDEGTKQILQNIIDNLEDSEKLSREQLVYKIDIIKKILQNLIGSQISEMTSTGAVAAYQTPYAFSKKAGGSKKAMDATEKSGYKKAEKGY